jgi:hypothetical protein
LKERIPIASSKSLCSCFKNTIPLFLDFVVIQRVLDFVMAMGIFCRLAWFFWEWFKTLEGRAV